LKIIFRERAHLRALSGAALVGVTLGVALGGSFLAGGAARAARANERSARLAAAAAHGFSDAALRTETASMDPGAVALAHRFDPIRSPASGASAQLARFDRTVPAPSTTSATPVRLETHPASRAAHGALESARELDCLADAVYYEARGESSEGQAAVAQVVLNRTRRGGYPKTVCGVVYQGAQSHACQFSFACDGAIYKTREPGAWRRAQGVAARALGGFVMTEVRDATSFHVASLGAIWGGNLIRVAQIGTHVFYKLTGHGGWSGHGARAGGDADDVDDAAPADSAQPTLILASALSAKPAGQPQPAATSGQAPAAAPIAEKPAPGAAAQAEPKAQS
jgi:spore germination cell wall hydrolase CwlJ-like protein